MIPIEPCSVIVFAHFALAAVPLIFQPLRFTENT